MLDQCMFKMQMIICYLRWTLPYMNNKHNTHEDLNQQIHASCVGFDSTWGFDNYMSLQLLLATENLKLKLIRSI